MTGPWILTATGKAVDLAEPCPSTIAIRDIAIALGAIRRFTGHSFLSVAQHSLIVADMMRARGFGHAGVIVGLLHDAQEAYIGDISTPMKGLLGKERIAAIEARFQTAIFAALGLEALLPDADIAVEELWDRVGEADHAALLVERTLFLPDHPLWPADPALRAQLDLWPQSTNADWQEKLETAIAAWRASESRP